MIVGCKTPMKIGQVHTGDYWYPEGDEYTVFARFYVIREATREEWTAYREDIGKPVGTAPVDGWWQYFYEVSTD